MNTKKLLLCSCALLCGLGLSSAPAQMRPHTGSHPTVAAGRFHDGDHGRHDRFHHRFFVRNFVFFGGFGYPYPYAYYSAYYPPYYYAGYPSGYSGSSLVIQVQERLARAGYYHGAIDGIIGSETHRAIRGYERAHGLPVDGRIDPSLLARMGLA